MKTLLLIAILVLILAAAWKITGRGKARRFGNKVADCVGLNRNQFHSALDNGVSGSSLAMLEMLEKAGLTPEQAGVEVGPSLAKGIAKLEGRFGPQPQIEAAKPTIAELVAKWEATRS